MAAKKRVVITLESSSDDGDSEARTMRPSPSDRFELMEQLMASSFTAPGETTKVAISVDGRRLLKAPTAADMLNVFQQYLARAQPARDAGDPWPPFPAHTATIVRFFNDANNFSHPAKPIVAAHTGVFVSDHVCAKDLLTLIDPRAWLCSAVMNTIGLMMEKKFDIAYLGTDFWVEQPNLFKKRDHKLPDGKYRAVASFANFNNHHWVLIVARPDGDDGGGSIHFYDSYHQSFDTLRKNTPLADKRFKAFLSLLAVCYPDTRWPRTATTVPLLVTQQDGHSCGLYAMHTLECLMTHMDKKEKSALTHATWDKQHFLLRVHYLAALFRGYMRDLRDVDQDTISEDLI